MSLLEGGVFCWCRGIRLQDFAELLSVAETADRCESSHGKPGTEANKPFGGNTWRIIPDSKW